MNDQAGVSALTAFTNVGNSSMRVFTVWYATAVLYLAQVFDPRCGELLADIAGMVISFGHESTEHPPLMAISVTWRADCRSPEALWARVQLSTTKSVGLHEIAKYPIMRGVDQPNAAARESRGADSDRNRSREASRPGRPHLTGGGKKTLSKYESGAG